MENMTTVNDTTNDGNGFHAMIGITEIGSGNGSGGSGGGGGGGGESGGGADEVTLKKGPWTAAEDAILIDYVTKHGEGNWNAVQRNTGLARCGKSCRLRWANHLRPNLKKGAFSPEEEKLIIELHAQFGNKWARMAALLPGRTDNEIKNYWNTRVKRRQRQGLPLYADDHDRPTTPTTPTTPLTPTGSNATTTKFEFFHQNHLHSPTTQHHHSPLSSPLQHRASSYSPRAFLETAPSPFSSSAHSPLSSSTTPSPLSFTFQRPAPLLCSPLRFKRYRSSPSFNLLSPTSTINPETPATTHFSDLDGFRFPIQLNSSSFSHFFQTPSLLDSDRGGVSSSSSPSAFQTKLELPSNQFSVSQPQQIEPEVKLDTEFNDPSLQTSSGFIGDLLLEAQALVSGQSSKKRNYLSLNEGNNNDVFDGCQSFDDLPLSSLYWPSTSGLKQKEEATDLSKSMNEDLSTLLTVMPSTMQGQDWQHNSATEVSNVQSSCVVTDDNFGLDIKPIASLFPLTNATNHNDNSGCYSWDNLPGLC